MGLPRESAQLLEVVSARGPDCIVGRSLRQVGGGHAELDSHIHQIKA